ncbi:MAG TPA: DUF998 domain-containing protein [Candidatus Saccharimonadales bacterium]|nr:DUF998 domain-containing protein [Candidatus Saccharimonadales bacterium]
MVTKLTKETLGAFLWAMSIQYYAVQIVVAASFSGGYNWAYNTISDLGNTRCGTYGERLVCSPSHLLMNISFVILGVTMIIGAVLLGKKFADGPMSRLGFSCVALSGIGSILVGAFPENTVSQAHVIGAALPFLLGNIGMVLLGFSLVRLPAALRILTVLCGCLGLIALILFLTHMYAGLQIGGMERIVSYPLTIWMILFGNYVLIRRRALR